MADSPVTTVPDAAQQMPGPIARALGDADYSMFVGLPAAGLLHLLFCRSPT